MTSLLHTVAFSVCCSSDEVNSERFNHGVTPGGGGHSHMKVTGMLVGKLELKPSWHTVHATEIEIDQSELSTRGKLSFPTS